MKRELNTQLVNEINRFREHGFEVAVNQSPSQYALPMLNISREGGLFQLNIDGDERLSCSSQDNGENDIVIYYCSAKNAVIYEGIEGFDSLLTLVCNRFDFFN
jgi:hypothetical protein